MRHKKLQASFIFVFLLFLVLFIGLAHCPHIKNFDIGTVEWKAFLYVKAALPVKAKRCYTLEFPHLV